MLKLSKIIFNNIYILINFLFSKFLKRKLSRITFYQFAKHYLVGFIGSSTNYTFFNVLKYLSLETKLANFITYVVVILESFLLQKYFTYRSNQNSIKQPVLFLIVSLVYYFIDTVILVLLIDKFMINPLISKIISIILLSPLSFLFQKFFVFKIR